MHWLRRSPANIMSTSPAVQPAPARATETASFCSWASAFSQLSVCKRVSSKVW